MWTQRHRSKPPMCGRTGCTGGRQTADRSSADGTEGCTPAGHYLKLRAYRTHQAGPSRVTVDSKCLSQPPSTFFEHVFVLRVSDGQRLLGSRTHRKFKTGDAWCNGDEGKCAIGVFA